MTLSSLIAPTTQGCVSAGIQSYQNKKRNNSGRIELASVAVVEGIKQSISWHYASSLCWEPTIYKMNTPVGLVCVNYDLSHLRHRSYINSLSEPHFFGNQKCGSEKILDGEAKPRMCKLCHSVGIWINQSTQNYWIDRAGHEIIKVALPLFQFMSQ